MMAILKDLGLDLVGLGLRAPKRKLPSDGLIASRVSKLLEHIKSDEYDGWTDEEIIHSLIVGTKLTPMSPGMLEALTQEYAS